MIKIEIPQVNYKGMEVLSTDPDILELGENYLRMVCRMTAKKEDETLGIAKEEKYDYDIIIPKNNIAAIDAGWAHAKEAYEISVFTTGASNSSCIVFPSRKEMKIVHNKIIEWLTK